MRRFIAFLLALLIALSLFAAVPASAASEDALWEAIARFEDNTLRKRAAASGNRAAYTPDAAEFAAMSADVEKIVTASAAFEPGSISRNGDFFFWKMKSGMPCAYSPRMRAQLRAEAVKGGGSAAAAGDVIQTVKRGSPGSTGVAVFQPYYGIDESFTEAYAELGEEVAQTLGGTCTVYRTKNATLPAIARAVQECGVVFFDSHGDTDYANGEDYTTRANTSYIYLNNTTGWTDEDLEAVDGPYGTYYHAAFTKYGSVTYAIVDGTAIANHMTADAGDSMVWMATCLGMATDGLCRPLRQRGVENVYGYSQSVTFYGDYIFMEYFWERMCDGYSAGESFAYMKAMANCSWDPYYFDLTESEARSEYAAFPILVSNEAPYPGHNNVDRVFTPRSEWTLLPRFGITAVSNDEALGTVSVSGRTVIAVPAEGCFAAGCEILEGEATVEREGDAFLIRAVSDCSLRVDFAVSTTVDLRFVTPEGVRCESVSARTGSTVTLPRPEGAPTVDPLNYTFFGWATGPVADTVEQPDCVRPGGAAFVAGETTYYALYSYAVDAQGVGTNGFKMLRSEPENWAGEYVITVNGETALDASGAYTGAHICSAAAAIPMEGAGMILARNTILNPADDVVYVIEPSTVVNGAYTIRMKKSGNYLALNEGSWCITTVTDPEKTRAQWYLSFSGEQPLLENVIAYDPEDPFFLQFDDETGLFDCFYTGATPITLFAGSSGTAHYTTDPAAAIPHVHDYDAVTVAPTCTASGGTVYTCARCGDAYLDNETAALGHLWGEWDAETDTCTCMRCGAVEQMRFLDVEATAWYAEAVLWAVDRNITNGTSEHTFSPDMNCTRAQVVTFLWNQAGNPAPTITENPFTDVGPDDWYYEAVLWAVEHDVTSGTTPTTFSPDKVCTRAEVVTFLWNAAGNTPPAAAENPFADVRADDWFSEAVFWAVEHDVTSGTAPATFSPAMTCTRAQIVQFLFNAARN